MDLTKEGIKKEDLIPVVKNEGQQKGGGHDT